MAPDGAGLDMNRLRLAALDAQLEILLAVAARIIARAHQADPEMRAFVDEICRILTAGEDTMPVSAIWRRIDSTQAGLRHFLMSNDGAGADAPEVCAATGLLILSCAAHEMAAKILEEGRRPCE